MNKNAYSLIEVVIAAAIVAIGVSAGAVFMNTLVVQGEQSASQVRAANLQEQATMLYRLGLTNPVTLYAILPETCSGAATPAAGAYGLVFGTTSRVTNDVTLDAGGSVAIAYDVATCTMVFANPVSGAGEVIYLTNSLDVVRPTIRVEP